MSQAKRVNVTAEILALITSELEGLRDGFGTVSVDCANGRVVQIRRQDGVKVRNDGEQNRPAV